jgi:hypothetical protein
MGRLHLTEPTHAQLVRMLHAKEYAPRYRHFAAVSSSQTVNSDPRAMKLRASGSDSPLR